MFKRLKMVEKLRHPGMKKMKLILLLAGLFCLGSLKAQLTVLRIDSNFLSTFPDTLHAGDVFNINLTIHNDSSFAYNGTVQIAAKINGVAVVADTGIQAIEDTGYANNVSIAANNFIIKSLTVHVLTPPFIIGSSGVVIWPISIFNGNQISGVDSLSKTSAILYPVGINEPNDKNLKVYLVGGQLTIQSDGEHLLKSVRIYDVEGALLNERSITTSGSINMDRFSSGIYLAEITFADNTQRVFRVFNGK